MCLTPMLFSKMTTAIRHERTETILRLSPALVSSRANSRADHEPDSNPVCSKTSLIQILSVVSEFLSCELVALIAGARVPSSTSLCQVFVCWPTEPNKVALAAPGGVGFLK